MTKCATCSLDLNDCTHRELREHQFDLIRELAALRTRIVAERANAAEVEVDRDRYKNRYAELEAERDAAVKEADEAKAAAARAAGEHLTHDIAKARGGA